MTGSGSPSPCGACKFLRRRCVRGCIFAPYFCHELGVSHFGAIHKVFGASNFSKLLSHLPVSDRCEAAITISYEAQARLQDPIYGCVSHIFALQQQVVNLQTQLASLKEQATQCFLNVSASNSENPNGNYYGNVTLSYPQDLGSWFQSEVSSTMASTGQLGHNISNYSNPFCENRFLDPNSSMGNNCGSSKISFHGFEEACHSNMPSLDMETDEKLWTYHDAYDLQSVAFGYSTQHW